MQVLVLFLRILGFVAGAAALLFAAAFFDIGESFLGVLAAVIGVMIIVLSLRKGRRTGMAHRHRRIAPAILAVSVTSVVIIAGIMAIPESRPQLKSTGDISYGTMAGKASDSSYGPGDTVELNGVTVTFHGVNETRGNNMFLEPDTNKIYAIAEFTVENNTNDYINISGFFWV